MIVLTPRRNWDRRTLLSLQCFPVMPFGWGWVGIASFFLLLQEKGWPFVPCSSFNSSIHLLSDYRKELLDAMQKKSNWPLPKCLKLKGVQIPKETELQSHEVYLHRPASPGSKDFSEWQGKIILFIHKQITLSWRAFCKDKYSNNQARWQSQVK